MSWKSVGSGLVISAIALYLAVRQVRPADTAAALRDAHPAPLLLGVALLVVALALRSWRWQLLFRPADRVSLHGAASATLIGYLVNSVLPGRLGELVRAYLIGETEGVGKGRALGTIVLEKLLDVLILLLFIGTAASQVSLPAWMARGAATAAAAAAIAILAFVALARVRTPAVAWMRARLDPLPGMRRLPLASLVGTALSAADGLARPVPLLRQLALSLALWGTSAAIVYTVMGAFDLSVPVTAAVLVLAVTNLGMTIPSAPAYVGVYHLLATETLYLFGVDRSPALSYAITMHALTFGVFILGGLFFMWHHQYAFADVWQRSLHSHRGATSSRQRAA